MKKLIIVLGIVALCLASCTQYVLLPPFWTETDESFYGDTWSGESDTAWYDPEAKGYAISTAEQLAGLAEIINNGTDEFDGVVFNLSQDIDLNGINWTPIGDEYTGTASPYNQEDTLFKGFKGTFNGNGHTIYNLTIERQTYNDNRIHYSDSFLGFFGNLEAGSSVSNLNFENVRIVGDSFIGILAGYIPSGLKGEDPEIVSISNINVSGSIEIEAKFSAGGILGRVESARTCLSMSNCTINADEGSYIRTPETIQNYESYSYLGGIIGAAYSSIENSFRNCSVSGLEISGILTAVGGFTGLLNPSGTVNIENCSVSDVTVSLTGSDIGTHSVGMGAFSGTVSSRVEGTSGALVISGSNVFDDITLRFPFAERAYDIFTKGIIGPTIQMIDGDQFTSPGNIDISAIDTSGITIAYL